MARSTDPDVVLLQAAADPTRLAILRQLAVTGGPVCACDLTGGADIRQPTVSHHLRVLREAGWVAGERRGTWIWYSLLPEAVERFRRLAASVEPLSSAPAASLGPGKRRLPVLDLDTASSRRSPAAPAWERD